MEVFFSFVRLLHYVDMPNQDFGCVVMPHMKDVGILVWCKAEADAARSIGLETVSAGRFR